ncbi:hypothetical protein V6V47_13700 [Micromonospora sp. CPCC 205539]|uniref:hypothetical protein n=1 Tax=Micromonospora sp. CPCC 205539 TaxID=3122408 RepID=UPI002FF3C48F
MPSATDAARRTMTVLDTGALHAAAVIARCRGCGTETVDGSPCDCVTCRRCHGVVAEDETTDTVRGSIICDRCLDECYWQCGRCDGWNRDGADCGNGCCSADCDSSSCRDDADDRGGLVEDYGYKPSPIFHGVGPLYLGPEIEVDTPPDRDWECAEVAAAHLDDLGYLKNDSTIGGGFEIVAHPMSYAWALEHFPWRMLDALRERGCEATCQTGMHVHVSRAAFVSPAHVYRWMKFIYRNERQVTRLARRSSPQWAAFTSGDRRAVKDYAKGARSQRYRAINTGNADTFELRIFASSLDPRQVKAAFGFAAASVEYTAHLSVREIACAGGWSWPAFVRWLAERPVYAPLSEQLEVLACAC